MCRRQPSALSLLRSDKPTAYIAEAHSAFQPAQSLDSAPVFVTNDEPFCTAKRDKLKQLLPVRSEEIRLLNGLEPAKTAPFVWTSFPSQR